MRLAEIGSRAGARCDRNVGLLPQLCRPVLHQRQRLRTLSGHSAVEQESLAILGHRIRSYNTPLDAHRLKQRMGNTQPRRWARGVHIHRSDVVQGIEEVQLLAVSPPRRVAAATRGDLPARAAAWKGSYVNFGAARLVILIGHPFTVRRDTGITVIKRALHYRKWLVIP